MALTLYLSFFCLTFFLAAKGCGPLPANQERTLNFTITDFKLPAVMVYSDHPMARPRVPTISITKDEAESYIKRLIMQSVEDVLYQQGRSALLSDNVISLILQQLNVQISYNPLKCDNVMTEVAQAAVMMKLNCLIVEGTVTRTCTNQAANMCMNAAFATNSQPVSAEHFLINGSVKTSNVVMVNWSNQMWQSVMNRVLRRITAGPNGSYFYGASVNLK